MDDPLFRALMETQRLHIAYRIGLTDMWDQIDKVLGRRATFLTETERNAIR